MWHKCGVEMQVSGGGDMNSSPPGVLLASSRAGGGNLASADEDGGGGNRWAREETLALLRIRSEMDATFRDATLKGPLWEHVSSKLVELGYQRRSAKKCKEKFENVHKYYKRTKEARQAGKSYKFFSQLDALHSTTASPPAAATNIFISPSAPPPINPTPISSIRFSPTSHQTQPHPFPAMFSPNAPPLTSPDQREATSFSTNTASTDDQEEGYNLSSRKRKRGSQTKRMMVFFEGMIKQVMQKQDAMQQSFLEAVEKTEQERVMREEAWKRQEMARLSRENELLAQERAISASRDAAIISFVQTITGRTIQLPPHLNINPPQSPAPIPVQVAPQQQQRPRPQPPSPSQQVQVHHQAPPVSTNEVMAVPEQLVRPQEMSGGDGSSEPSSSRWPKAEILSLINLRSGLESRYQEAGPKGPLWEEISVGMQRMGYKRSAKRCKEKWENINKYFKKVKESNKKRPEDAKTCPYFHQLDALYSKKILTSSSFGNQNALEQQQAVEGSKLDPIQPATTTVPAQIAEPENKTGGSTDAEKARAAMAANLFGESTGGPAKKPEDIVKEMMADDDYDKIEEGDSYNMEDDEDEEVEEERKMDYKMEFQRQNTTTAPNGAANGAPSFFAMVQ